MEVIGKITYVLPEVSGTSKAGNPWKKKEYVLETLDTYPKKIYFDFFGERADQFPLQIGQVIKLVFDIESREYNGRWFTSIRGLRAEDPNQTPMGAPAQGYQAPAGYPAAPAPYPAAPAAYPAAPAGYPAEQMPGSVPPPPAMPAADPADDLPF